MDLHKYLNEDLIFLNYNSGNKKNILENISFIFSKKLNIDDDIIFKGLYEREKLGTTALGDGVALPHARIDSIEEIYILIMRLKKSIDFEAIDEKKVDIIFTLLVPNIQSEEHVNILSKIASLLDNKENRKKLRNLSKPVDIISLVKNL